MDTHADGHRGEDVVRMKNVVYAMLRLQYDRTEAYLPLGVRN